MGNFYGIKILNGKMYMEDVPSFWKNSVLEWLSKNGTTSEDT